MLASAESSRRLGETENAECNFQFMMRSDKGISGRPKTPALDARPISEPEAGLNPYAVKSRNYVDVFLEDEVS